MSKIGDTPYYDSRWTIPIAWFFFFKATDVQRVNVVSGGSWWQEVKFLTLKEEATATFAARRCLLQHVVEAGLEEERVIQRLAESVAAWDGEYLRMDPSEIFDGGAEDDSQNFSHCTHILRCLDDPQASAPAAREAMRVYSRFDFSDADDFAMRVTGVTYG